MGNLSRRKGAAFERRCRAIMADITAHPFWRRAPGGEVQYNGDLVPCHEDQEIITLPDGPLYVECKITAMLQKSKMDDWLAKIEEMRKGKDWYLLFAQDRGPVYVYSGGDNKGEFNTLTNADFLGPLHLTFKRS